MCCVLRMPLISFINSGGLGIYFSFFKRRNVKQFNLFLSLWRTEQTHWFGNQLDLNLRMEKGTVLNIVQWTAQWLEAEKRVGIGSNLLSRIFFTGWYVWKARNEFIFNNLPISPPAIASRITQAWIGDQHQHSGDISPIVECLTPALLGEQEWHPPPAGEFKINCDGSFSTNQNIASAAAILRDSEG